MSLFGFVVKTGLIAGAVIVGQRLWDRYQTEELYEELDVLTDDCRNDRNRHGTVKANVRAKSVAVVQSFEAKITYVASLTELRERVEIYIESIPD